MKTFPLHKASCIYPRSGKVRSREDWLASPTSSTWRRRRSHRTVRQRASEVVHLNGRISAQNHMTTSLEDVTDVQAIGTSAELGRVTLADHVAVGQSGGRAPVAELGITILEVRPCQFHASVDITVSPTAFICELCAGDGIPEIEASVCASFDAEVACDSSSNRKSSGGSGIAAKLP